MDKKSAIEHFGGTKALAAALNLTYQAVHGWESIPLARQYQIQVLSEGKLKADPSGPKSPQNASGEV